MNLSRPAPRPPGSAGRRCEAMLAWVKHVRKTREELIMGAGAAVNPEAQLFRGGADVAASLEWQLELGRKCGQ